MSIDRVGRLVIPKHLGDAVGLRPGSSVELSIDGAALRVESVAGTGFVEENGLRVIPASGFPITDKHVRDLRRADPA